MDAKSTHSKCDSKSATFVLIVLEYDKGGNYNAWKLEFSFTKNGDKYTFDKANVELYYDGGRYYNHTKSCFRGFYNAAYACPEAHTCIMDMIFLEV